tara:strand:- start:1712 stop:2095 length:384 start_codon:yes stop_codon:yes gene_type:complete
MDNIKVGSNRSFGIVFFVFFLIISIYPIFLDQDIRLWSLLLSLIFLILGLTKSRILTPLNLLWFKFGMLLGRIVSPIVMGLVFFLVVTPTGLIMRGLKKDLLKLKKKKSNTYWVNRDQDNTDMRNQF